MKLKILHIDIYNWDVVYVEIDFTDTADKVKDATLKKIRIVNQDDAILAKDVMSEIDLVFNEKGEDGGVHLCNFGIRISVVIINPCNSKKSKIKTVAHELRHVTDRILQHLDINDFEAAAYLQDFIFSELITL